LDNVMTAQEILDSYDEISIDQIIIDSVFIITLAGKQFLFIAPFEDDPSSEATVYLYNDSGVDCPHIMLLEKTFPNIEGLPEGKYRWVCLYESDSMVNTIVSYENKIIDAADRLIELLSMSDIEKEREFQKEFLFYWNYFSTDKKDFTIYLTQENTFAEMDAYYGDSKVRIIEKGMVLSDIDSRKKDKRCWTQHVENEVFYIPIIDNRGILPPHRGFSWTAQTIGDILYGQQVEHISNETYQKITETFPKTQNIVLVFGMRIGESSIAFSARLNCNNAKGHNLLEKVLNDTVAVEPLFSNRKDYSYFNEQIGNDIGLLNKKVLVIGAGSLGSYVTFELVKNGASHVKVYDGDKLEDENILRWAYGGIGKGSNKALVCSYLLNTLHPEVQVDAVSKYIDDKALIQEASQVDLIISTVGSSDEQLKFNRVLKAVNCSVPVVYVWLEEGGIYSHVLFVDYQKTGCYECLYTDEYGNMTNNRARKAPDTLSEASVIRNGCGGTRAAYGTAILLRTTAALLEIIQRIMTQQYSESVLIDVAPNIVSKSNVVFPLEACNCCGDKSFE